MIWFILKENISKKKHSERMVHSFQIAYLLYKFIKLQDQIRRNAMIDTDLSKKDQQGGVNH